MPSVRESRGSSRGSSDGEGSNNVGKRDSNVGQGGGSFEESGEKVTTPPRAIAYRAMRCAVGVRKSDVTLMVLPRSPYQMSGTRIPYGAVGLRTAYGMCSTELAYGAMAAYGMR
eukprot:712014-Rhodomonas_salina.1